MAKPMLTKQVSIAAPPRAVFDLAADFPNAATHVPGIDKIEMLTEGPVGVGTRFRETRGKMGAETLEVTRFEPPTQMCVEADSCGCRFASTFHFIPEGEGTLVRMEIASEPRTFFAKLMSPLGGLMAGVMGRMIEKDLEGLKQVAESGTEVGRG
ncbi:Polyketide cyclase / dehydrase and lipid transport [Pirellulimonas nuda]|uniref:Polyketide cyclase / dehydrase and lipid transport n=1 Tax=Pirellulimonas nuda TaxID=2528009 RepID=A0A518D7E5_9BACT|nr:SRPBCC family protein [Pirellulimonas nuda]QDU87381.1 Polyketide cyclase / dehydrase and lipid transport [Pirellulimonas nuda]